MTRPNQTELLSKLEVLRPALARAAQSVVDCWEQDEEGYDEELGGGGVGYMNNSFTCVWFNIVLDLCTNASIAGIAGKSSRSL